MQQVRAQDHGGAGLGPSDDRTLHAPDPHGVEPGQGLVEQQRLGAMKESTRDQELLLHPARQLAWQRLAFPISSISSSNGGDAVCRIGDLVQPSDEAQMLFHREVLEEVGLIGDKREL